MKDNTYFELKLLSHQGSFIIKSVERELNKLSVNTLRDAEGLTDEAKIFACLPALIAACLLCLPLACFACHLPNFFEIILKIF